MRLPIYLKRTRNGVYYFRCAVSPSPAQAKNGIDFCQSLRTRNPREAASLSRVLGARMQKVLPAIRAAMRHDDPGVTTMIDDLKRSLRHWTGELRLGNGATLTLRADPSNPADMAAASAELREAFRLVLAASSASSSPGPIAADVAPRIQPTIDTAIENWISVRGRKWAEKTKHEFPRIARDFAQWAKARGRVAIEEITRKDISEYIDDLQKREWRKKTATKAAKCGLSMKTINKYLAALSSLFKESHDSGLYSSAPPTTNQFFDDEDVAETSESWERLTDADVMKVFEPLVYRQWARKPCQFWVPLLMLHGGLRVGEAAQLCTSDVVKTDGIFTLNINKSGPGKKLKNRASARVIPLHRKLIRLGFLRYVRDIHRIAGDGPIFPWLRADSMNGFGDVPGEALNAYLKRQLHDPRKRGHSMRHTANDMLSQDLVQEQHRCQLMGHSHKTINTKVYTKPLSFKKLAEVVMPHLRFPLDYRSLRYRRGQFDEIIRRELNRRRRHLVHKAKAATRLGVVVEK